MGFVVAQVWDSLMAPHGPSASAPSHDDSPACGGRGKGLYSTLFKTLKWCWSSLLGNEKCVMLLSLQEKSASAGRKLIVSCIKKYMSKQHIQEIVTGWSILVGGPRWTQNDKGKQGEQHN